MTDNLIPSVENYYEISTLPEKPDEEKVIQPLIKIRERIIPIEITKSPFY